jgi:hypothetical protein
MSTATLLDTGPPGAVGGPRLSGKSRGTGRKFASYRGERLNREYQPSSSAARRNAEGGSLCQR